MSNTIKFPKKIKKADIEAARDRLFELKQVQNEAREEEISIREWLAQFHDGDEGTKTVVIEGVKMAIGKPITRSITAEDAERLCNDYPEISVEVLKWKPEVRVAAYKANAEIVDPYITTKPGLVTVEFR